MRELWLHQLRSTFQEFSAIPPHINTFSWSVGESRPPDQFLHAFRLKLPACNPRSRREADLVGKGISAFDTPELPEGSIVDIKRYEPIRQSRVVDAMHRVAPLTKKDQLRAQSIGENPAVSLNPARKGFELWMQGVPREKCPSVLDSELITIAQRNPDVGTIDLLLHDEDVKQ